jgi:putative transposase
MELLQQRDPEIPLQRACEALAFSRATLYRLRRPKTPRPPRRRTSPARRLSEGERSAILDVLHSERFADQPPAEVYATLLEEGVFLASPRTMYRVLAATKQTKERRLQRTARSLPKPSLTAWAPNQVWTWDISKLPTFTAGIFLNLYVILDLWSRYVVAWMIAERENSALAKQLFAEAISRSGIEPGALIVHMDRGAPMTSIGFAELLSVFGVDRSYSRPRISNDNPFSESQFKTLKYQPDYPGAFDGTRDSRIWARDYFEWYNTAHHHHGLALYTPATLYFGDLEAAVTQRQRVLDVAYARHPERFIRGRPIARRPPHSVSINPVSPDASSLTAADLLDVADLHSLTPSRFIAPDPLRIHVPGAQAAADPRGFPT